MGINSTPYSGLKLLAHHDKIESIKKGERVAPLYIRIKPINICNHKCFYCSYAVEESINYEGVNLKDQIPWEKMKEIIADLGDMRVKAVTFSGGGEPTVYPFIIPTMKGILEKGIDLSIITNGQKLDGEIAEILSQAKWVRISFDAADAQTYQEIRRIPISYFNTVCKNISKFAKQKSKACELGINFVVNHKNANKVYEFAKFVKELGANHVKFAARITKNTEDYHRDFKENVIEQIHLASQNLTDSGFKIINKYEEDFGITTVFHRTYKKCFVKEVVTVIAADSKVYFCHDKAYVEEGLVGDLNKCSFKELWFSPEVIERYRKFDASKECNHHCVYDDRNILMNTFFDLDENHINFI